MQWIVTVFVYGKLGYFEFWTQDFEVMEILCLL